MTITRKRAVAVVIALIVVIAAAYLTVCCTRGNWKGVDENVVEKFAEQAGRPATRPVIDTDHGDLLLFVFLLAGTAGGFVLGYYFRDLMGKKGQGNKNAPDA